MTAPAEFSTVLKTFPLFADFTDTDLRALSALFRHRHLDEGEVFVKQGERDGPFALVLAGALSAFRRLPDGREVFLGRIGPGQVVGYLSLVDHQPRTATVRAAEPSELAELSGADFHLLLTSNTPLGLRFQLALARDIVRTIRGANRRFALAAALPSADFANPAHLDGLYEELDPEPAD